jgi:predicted nucleic acid-binding protein
MKYLFDASSVLPITSNMDEQRALRLFANGYLLDLTKYEVGNAIWKQYALRHSIDEKELNQLFDLLGRILPKAKVVAVAAEDLADVAKIAVKEKATFYDSSYIASAKRWDFTLVTDDSHLAKLAAKEVKVASSRQVST